AHNDLVDLCLRPGGQVGSYAAALYTLVLLHDKGDDALGYLTDAIDLLSGGSSTYHRELPCLLRFARAAAYLGQGNAQAAADDLVFASWSHDDKVRIISGSLSSLLQRQLPKDQAYALWRVIEDFKFPVSPEVTFSQVPLGFKPREFGDQDWLEWYNELADVLWRHVPRLVPDAPLRTVDLFQSQETPLPKSFSRSPSRADAAMPSAVKISPEPSSDGCG